MDMFRGRYIIFSMMISTCFLVSGCARHLRQSVEHSAGLKFQSETVPLTNEQADDKTWLFAVDGRKQPYSYFDDGGKLVGFDVDLISKVCQRANKKCSMVLAEFTECAFTNRDVNLPGRGLMAEWFDGCPSYTISIDRSAGFDFSLPYLGTACTFTVLPGNPSKFDPTADDYSKFTITHLTGAVSNTRCLERLGKKFGNVIVADDLPDARGQLVNGTADVLFSPRTKIPDLEVLPDKFHCELGGAGVMTKKGSLLSSWWDPIFTTMVSTGEFQQFCQEESAKYDRTFKCLDESSISSNKLLDALSFLWSKSNCLNTSISHLSTTDAQDDKTWLFAVSGRRKPFNYLDAKGYLTGFDLEFIEKVCKIAGKKCSVVLSEFTECSFTNREINYPGRGLMDSWFDACVGYVDSVDRANGFDFTDAYLRSYSTYSVLPGNPSGFDPKADFSNFTFTYLTGAYTNVQCLNRLRKTVKNVVIAENLPDAKRILQERKADVLFSPRARIPDLETFPERVHCELTGTSMMVKKGSLLPSWWNKAFETFTEQGGYKTLCHDETRKYDYTFKCFNQTNDESTTDLLPAKDAQDDKTWLFSVSGRRKPFNYVDESGVLVGFDLDFISSVCKVANKKCSVVLTEFTECSFTNREISYPGRGLMEGWFDACVGYANSVDRANGFDFTDAYLRSYSTYTVQPGNPSGFNPNFADYSNFTFTYLTGAYTNVQCLNRLKKTVKNVVIAENLPDAKRILQERKADVLFSPRSKIPDLETFPERVHCELTGTSMMVKKGSPLPSWWNKAFETFTKQGGYKTLCEDGIVKYNFPIKCFSN